MLVPIILCAGFLMILERVVPDQKLGHVKGWWFRVLIINLIQLGVIFLAGVTWDKWFSGYHLLPFNINTLPFWLSGFFAYFLLTFIFYWWHRWRHTVNLFWLIFHQVHHSPKRIETITSFYKHPLEILCNSLIISVVNYLLLGISVESAGWCLLYSSFAEYFYHMNIKTPHWVGYIFQRPEMHRIHHQRGKHFNNFSDFPFWDMLFGTFSNPTTYQGKCGFKGERERSLFTMLFFKNVNDSIAPPKENDDAP